MFNEQDIYLETKDTKHRDYILMPYAPLHGSTVGKLHNQTLFWHIVRELGWRDFIRSICDALVEFLGPDETVWGVKYGPQGCSVEFYFYNFTQNEPDNRAQLTKIARALQGVVTVPGRIDETIRYFMCSFEVNATSMQTKAALPWRIYTRTGEVNRTECGFSYRAEETLIMENHYWFYMAKKKDQLADVIYRLKSTFRAGKPSGYKVILPRELRDCHTICYAVKPKSDGLYFSRIATSQLIWFFENRWPHALLSVLKENEEELSHLRWDLGIDFSASAPSAMVNINKMGIYGVL